MKWLAKLLPEDYDKNQEFLIEISSKDGLLKGYHVTKIIQDYFHIDSFIMNHYGKGFFVKRFCPIDNDETPCLELSKDWFRLLMIDLERELTLAYKIQHAVIDLYDMDSSPSINQFLIQIEEDILIAFGYWDYVRGENGFFPITEAMDYFIGKDSLENTQTEYFFPGFKNIKNYNDLYDFLIFNKPK